MSNLYSTVEKLRTEYREIFTKSAMEIQRKVNELKPHNLKGDIFDQFPSGSDGHKWQCAVLDMLENEISKEIYRKFQEVLAYRKEFRCVGCATCCNLACSEFSPEELNRRAENGDNFAKQFTSIFIPYESKRRLVKSILNIFKCSKIIKRMRFIFIIVLNSQKITDVQTTKTVRRFAGIFLIIL